MASSEGYDSGVLSVKSSSGYDKNDFWVISSTSGSLAGICLDSAAANELVSVQTRGLFRGILKASPTQVIADGATLHAGNGAKTLTTTSGSGRFPVGYAVGASAATKSTVDVILAPGIG